MMGPALTVLVWSLAGSALASVFACVPGLHIYNVMGAAAAALVALGATGRSLPSEAVVAAASAAMAAYAVVGAVPSILVAAPDESALFTVLPGQKYLAEGRGREALAVTTLGSVAALTVLLAGGAFAPSLAMRMHNVVSDHLHWMIWCVITFMLMSEWPKGGTMGQGGWRKLREGWRSPGVGLLTFGLSGVLGFILMYRSPVKPGAAFQNLMPAFVGLFTVPWLLLNIVTRTAVPEQRSGTGRLPRPREVLHGAVAGCLGGGFAAFVPAVTGGVGGFLAGHATAVRNDRVFLVSQGASRVMYYVGGLLLFFAPGLHLRRGGGAWLLSGIIAPETQREYFAALAAVGVGGAASLLLMVPLTEGTLRTVARWGYRKVSWAALGACLAVVLGFTGWQGTAVAVVSAGIGLIPVLYGSRRMNCLGVVLLPVACNMSGLGPGVAQWLGLV